MLQFSAIMPWLSRLIKRFDRLFPAVVFSAGLLSLPLAVVAQWQIDQRLHETLGWSLLAVAAFGFLLFFPRHPLAAGSAAGSFPILDGQPWGFIPTIVGATAALVSYAFFGDNHLTLPGVLLWLGGLITLWGGAVGFGQFARYLGKCVQALRTKDFQLSGSFILVAMVTAVGALFRFWNLAELPAEPGVDLPLILMSVEQVLDGEWPIFFSLHPGREGLYIYVAAAFVKLFGLSYPGLRMVGALIGVITIPVLYWVGRRFFNREAGLVAAALLAVNRWHITLSRTGLRFVFMPLFCLLLVVALHRALNGERRRCDWIAVGIILGWGFFTYNAWLIMPVLVVGTLLLHRLSIGDWRWDDARCLLIAFGVALLVW